MSKKRVVVTGLGALSPLGNDVDTSWNNAINGVSESVRSLVLMLKNIRQK